MKRIRALLALAFLLPTLTAAAEGVVRVELNTTETAENRCRLTFLVENKTKSPIESLQLDLVLFGVEGVIQHRMLTELAPVRALKTIVRTYAADGECNRIGSIMVNDIPACAPGTPDACLDGLELSSRLKSVRFYK